MLLQGTQREGGFCAGWYLLNHHGRSAHLGGRDDEEVVGEFIGVEDRDRAVAEHPLDEHHADVGVAATAGAEEGGTAREIGQVCGGQLPAQEDASTFVTVPSKRYGGTS